MSLLVINSEFCGCVEDLVCFRPAVNFMIFESFLPLWCFFCFFFSCRLIFAGGIFMLLIPLPSEWGY